MADSSYFSTLDMTQTHVSPLVGCMTAAAAVCNVVTAADFTSNAASIEVRARGTTDGTEPTASSPVISDVVTATGNYEPINLTITAGGQADKIRYLLEYRVDGGEWVPSSRTFQYFNQRTDAGPYRFVIDSDPHTPRENVGVTTNFDPTRANGWNMQRTYSHLVEARTIANAHGSQPVGFEYEPEFCVFLGDTTQLEHAPVALDACGDAAIWRRTIDVIACRMGGFFVYGNHEGTAGFFQWGDGSTSPVLKNMLEVGRYVQRWSTQAHRTFVPVIGPTTYPQGAEGAGGAGDTDAEWRPPAVDLSGATWTQASFALSKTGAFAGYSVTAGDEVYVSGGTGVTPGWYAIVSKTSDNAIVLATSIGAGADGQTDIAAKVYKVWAAGGASSIAGTKSAVNGGPLGNFYAFAWGDATFVMLDPYRYTNVGSTWRPGYASEWTLGATQWAWLETVLAGRTTRHGFVFCHHQLGGYMPSPGVQRAYGRGFVNTFRVASDANGAIEQAALADLMDEHGWRFWFQGHDHVAACGASGPVMLVECPRAHGLSNWITNETMLASYGEPWAADPGDEANGGHWYRPLCGFTAVLVTTEHVAVEFWQTVWSYEGSEGEADPWTWTPENPTPPRDWREGRIEFAFPVVDGKVLLPNVPDDVDGAWTAEDAAYVEATYEGPVGTNYYTDLAAAGHVHDEPYRSALIAVDPAVGAVAYVDWVPRLYRRFVHREQTMKPIGAEQAASGVDLYNGGAGHEFAAVTIPQDCDVTIALVLSGLSGTGSRNLRVFLDGGRVCDPVWDLAPSTNLSSIVYRRDVRCVEAGQELLVRVDGVSGDTNASVSLKLWATDAMSALNVAMPSSKTAGSVVEAVQLAKAALVNRRTHVVEEGTGAIWDNDGDTVLVTLTPSEANGVIEITPS